MPIARIACSVILRVEIYDEADGPDGRLLAEQKATATARDQAATGVSGKLNPGAGSITEDLTRSSPRPSFALPPLAPLSWAVTYNTFRRADELEITIPLSALPVPLASIRVLTCSALVRQVSADDWAEGMSAQDLPARLFARNEEASGDFEGICSSDSLSSGEGLPKLKLKFLDYVGLLASKAVPVGKELDREISVTKAIRDFLIGSPAEGLDVVWVDTGSAPEPKLGMGVPKAQKRGKEKAKAPTHAGQKYLDVITQECARTGVVARVSGARLECAFAGTMYAGEDRGGQAKATLLLGGVIEDFEAEHDLIGSKIHSIGVVSYDPDTGKHLTARWPPDPKGIKPITYEPGKPPRLPPIQANVGLPGATQLDESILMIPVAPCSDPELLPQMARAIFVERTRQKVKYKISTHAPWADPDDDDADSGPLLRLRAGDNVRFGVVSEERAMLPRELRAIVAGADAGATAALLRGQGVKPDVADRVAVAIASAPTASLFRVDELKISCGEKDAPKLELAIVNFTVIVADMTSKATGKTVGDFVEMAGKLLAAAAGQMTAEVQAGFEAAFRDLSDSDLPPDTKEDARGALMNTQKEALKGRQ